MKIVTWNCDGALRKKFEHLFEFDADIYIIQECENPEGTNHLNYIDWAENHVWVGDTKNKGLGVFAAKHLSLSKLDWSNIYQDHPVKYFLPCRINGKLDLLAIWAHQNNSPTFQYIGQAWKYIQINKKKLNKTIIAGDLNSNAIWDVWDRWWNHADVLKELEEIGIESFYHRFNQEKQGEESTPTLYFQKNLNKPYHIDYIFGPKLFSENLKSLEIGHTDKWLAISDHMPIFCEFSDNI